ncbi:MAG: hypothetical protein RI909_593, partial [Bacteroidota bacterium]
MVRYKNIVVAVGLIFMLAHPI